MSRLLAVLALMMAGTNCAPAEKTTAERNQSSSKSQPSQDDSISDKKNSADAKSDPGTQKDASTVEKSEETISEKNSATTEPSEPDEAHQDTEGKGFTDYDILAGQNLHIHFTEKEGVLSCKSCPPGTKIDQEARLISWTPTADTQEITAFELDSNVSGTHSNIKFSVTITDPAKAPVFDAIENMTATKFKYLSFTVSAKDPQGAKLPILYSCDTCPTNMTINQSGFVEWTPTGEQIGVANVTIRASTIYYQIAKKTLTITVNDSDDPPEFTPIEPLQINELDTVTFDLKAKDPNGSPVTYRCKDGCANGAVLTGATVSWTPTISQSGNYVMTFAASDGKNESTLDVQIAVIDKPMRGAFAISIGDSVAAWKFGFGKDETTFDKASAEAIAECKAGACVVEDTYTNSCAAFAANSPRAEKNYSVSWGSGYASRKLAEEGVLANCNAKANAAKGAPCAIIGWSCSGVGTANEVAP